MRPVYFGSSARPLFGIHDPPRSVSARNPAILLCYPGMQEYSMAHWAFRRLSGTLAREGFHVLRFDWTGTGDSWGSPTDGTPQTWLTDIVTAARELQDAAGTSAISVVGRRLGATMAALACAENLGVETLVLWDPVVSGPGYLRELEVLDARENMRLLRGPRSRQEELLGFPVTRELRAAIEEIDLRNLPRARARNVAVVSTADRAEYRQLARSIAAGEPPATYEHVPEDPSSTNAGEREAALLYT